MVRRRLRRSFDSPSASGAVLFAKTSIAAAGGRPRRLPIDLARIPPDGGWHRERHLVQDIGGVVQHLASQVSGPGSLPKAERAGADGNFRAHPATRALLDVDQELAPDATVLVVSFTAYRLLERFWQA